jgi:diguanylate cyclase (GGDEF)-like protein
MAWISSSESLIFDLSSALLLLFASYAYYKYRPVLRALKLHRPYYLVLLGLALVTLPVSNFIQTFESYLGSKALAQISIASELIGLSLILIGIIRILTVGVPALKQRMDIQEKSNFLTTQNMRKLQDELDSQSEHIRSLKAELSEAYIKQYDSEVSESLNLELYRKLIDDAPILMFAISDTFNIDDVNSYACDQLGYSFGELVSSRFLDVVVPEQRRFIQSELTKLFRSNHDSVHIETKFLRQKSGSMSVTINRCVDNSSGDRRLYLFCLDMTEARALSESLAFQASHDDLTELYNRRAFESYLSEKIEQLRGLGLPLAVIYMDVDQLKVVNDTCGHFAGDQLLQQLVFILKDAADQEDIFFARIGGDEFVIVQPGCDRNKAHELAETLRSAAEDFVFVWEGKQFRQSISIGVAVGNTRALSVKEFLSSADAACYSAKENGRNQVIVHDAESSIHSDNRQSMHWVSRLQKAVSKGDFALYFQPIVPISTQNLHYMHYEVLIQYIDDNGQPVPPSKFLPAAERYGISSMIDLWVITEVLDFLQKNPQHTRALHCCSINLTSHSLASHRTRSAITQLIKSSSFPANKICFEITESSAIQNLADAVEFIRTLKELGCKFALDDFGTGFSSFAYLKNLDVDYLKIDGSFVRDIVSDKIDKAMIRAISDVAQHMNIKTVAEYVENDSIMRELRGAQVDMGQGFGIAKPMPMDALDDFYHYQKQSSL